MNSEFGIEHPGIGRTGDTGMELQRPEQLNESPGSSPVDRMETRLRIGDEQSKDLETNIARPAEFGLPEARVDIFRGNLPGVEQVTDGYEEQKRPVNTETTEAAGTSEPTDSGDLGPGEPEEAEATEAAPEELGSKSEASREDGPHITDLELAKLLVEGVEAMGQAGLDRVLEAHQDFNMPTRVIGDDGTDYLEPNFAHKRLLKEIPAYVETASNARVDPEQAGDLLAHALGAVRYPEVTQSEYLVVNLAKALGATDEGRLTPDNLQGLKDLIAKAGESDVIEVGLTAYAAGKKAGLSTEESMRLVNDHIDTANSRQLGYMMHHFSDALQALASAGVAPAVISEVFDRVCAMDPEVRGRAYNIIEEAVTFSTSARRTPAETMDEVVAKLRGGGDQALPESEEIAPTVFMPHEQRDRLFPEAAAGPLEHRATTYRKQRSFADGIRDIALLTNASTERGEQVSEGQWVFDPQTETWYSLGGQTSYLGEGRARHRGNQYDVSDLSPTPYSIHIHPREFADGADVFGYVFPSNADFRAVASMIDSAYRPMRVRSFISHPLGVTEFTCPADANSIRRLGEIFEDMRDTFFDRFGGLENVMAVGRSYGETALAQTSVNEVNAMLPDGFELRYYPPGATIE